MIFLKLIFYTCPPNFWILALYRLFCCWTSLIRPCFRAKNKIRYNKFNWYFLRDFNLGGPIKQTPSRINPAWRSAYLIFTFLAILKQVNLYD